MNISKKQANLAIPPKTVIVIEGLDGSGKSTTALELEKYYKTRFPDLKTTLVAFPKHGEPSGYLVDQYLQKQILKKSSAITTSLLFSVDKAIYFEEHQKELIDADILIFDRFYLSNVVYQMPSSYLYDYNTMDVLYPNEFLYYLYTIYINEVIPFLNILSSEYVDTAFNELVNLYNPRGTSINQIAKYLEKFAASSCLNSMMDNFHTFNIYHPNIVTNQELLNRTGKELDRNEKELDYLSKVSDSFNILWDFAHRGVVDKIKEPRWFFNGEKNAEEDDDNFNKLILNPSLDLFKRLFSWERTIGSDTDGQLYPTKKLVETIVTFVGYPPRATKKERTINDESKTV